MYHRLESRETCLAGQETVRGVMLSINNCRTMRWTREVCTVKETALNKVHSMRQTIKARYHNGVLKPLEPLALPDEAEVQLTIDTAASATVDEILERAGRVYQGLTGEQIAQVDSVALDQGGFFREPAA